MCLRTQLGRTVGGSFDIVAAPPETVTCVHCKKTFETPVVGANTRHAGYKCPHCKLYMPLARTVVTPAAGAA